MKTLYKPIILILSPFFFYYVFIITASLCFGMDKSRYPEALGPLIAGMVAITLTAVVIILTQASDVRSLRKTGIEVDKSISKKNMFSYLKQRPQMTKNHGWMNKALLVSTVTSIILLIVSGPYTLRGQAKEIAETLILEKLEKQSVQGNLSCLDFKLTSDLVAKSEKGKSWYGIGTFELVSPRGEVSVSKLKFLVSLLDSGEVWVQQL